MRLLYVCADKGIPLCGAKGAAAHVRQVTAALAGRGHQVTLACRDVDGDNRRPVNVTVETMPEDEREHHAWLDALVRRRSIEAVIERYSLASGPAHHVAAAHGLALLLEVNAPLVQEAAAFRGLQDVEQWTARERTLLRSADAVVAVSDAVAAHARAAGAAADRVIVVPNGVDVDAFAGGDGAPVRARCGLTGTTVVGFCGSLKPWHGVDILIDAMLLLGRDVHLLVVGDGPQRDALVDRAGRCGLTDRLVMTGAVPHHAVPGHLAAMDIAVAPYGPMAGFYFSPLKVLEYLAAGLPVVATDQGALRDLAPVVALVPPGDAPALGSALAALLAADPAERRRRGERGRALAATRSWGSVAQRLEELLGATAAVA